MAHPDDEVVGAGARLPRLREASLVHVTDGSPRDLGDALASGCATREEYARVRREELAAALKHVGIGPGQTHEIGCVDQEASLNLVPLAREVARLLRELRPEVVITHPYEGGHPDHDATAFAVHVGCWLLQAHDVPPPALIEMTSYHNGPNGIEVYEFLPNGGSSPVTLVLSEEERELKRRMLECFPTQQGTLRLFPVEIERFRLAPVYDFTQAPHEGQLFYEGFSWGMTGARFRELAGEALGQLGFGGAP